MEFPDSYSNVRNVLPIKILYSMKSTLIFLIALLSVSRAQIPSVGGQCPTKTPSSPIDIKQITGQWYEIEASPTFFEFPYKCISIKVPKFYEKKSEISIDAKNRISKDSGTIQRINARIPDSSNEKDGKIRLNMISPFDTPEGEVIYGPELRERYVDMDLQILATDYNNWILVWSCKQHEGTNAHTEFVWILSRQRILTEDQYRAVSDAKQSHGVEWIKTRDTIQSDCSNEHNDSYDDYDNEYAR